MEFVPDKTDVREYETTISRKGQITLPLDIRRLLKLHPKDKITIRFEEGEVKVVPRKTTFLDHYQSVSALASPHTWEEMLDIAYEDHMQEVVEKGI